MLRKSYLRLYLPVLSCVFLAACGGGGGGGGGSAPIQQSSSSIASSTAPFTRQLAPSVAGAFVDVADYATNLPYDLFEELSLYAELPDGTEKANCEKGLATIKVANSGRSIQEHYEKCQFDGIEMDGDRLIDIVATDSVIGAKVNYTFKQLVIRSISDATQKQSWDGVVTYVGGTFGRSDSDSTFSVDLDLVIDDARDGRLEVNNFKLQESYDRNQLQHPMEFHHNLSSVQTISGNFIFKNNIRFSLEKVATGVALKGDNNSRLTLLYDLGMNMVLNWDETGDGLADARLVIPQGEEFSISDMIALGNKSPSFLFSQHPDKKIQEGFQYSMARGASLDVYVQWNFTHESASLLNFELNGKSSNGAEWVQLDPGHFRLSFASNTVDENYDLTFVAIDSQGNKSPGLHAKLYVGADLDKDGVPNGVDDDDDGDIVKDVLDKFPLDPKESEDADGDGVGDHADPDFDSSVQQGLVWFIDKNSVAYFQPVARTDWEAKVNKNYSKRWDYKTNSFLPELELNNRFIDESYYSKEQHKLYYSSNSDIYVVDLNSMQQSLFLKANASLARQFVKHASGNLVVVARASNMGTVYESYTASGVAINSIQGEINRDSAPFYAPDLAPFCAYYITIDSEGKLFQQGTFENRFDKCFFSSVKVSQDGRYVYRSRGGVPAEEGMYLINGTFVAESHVPALHWLVSGLVAQEDDVLSLYSPKAELLKQFRLPANSSIMASITNGQELFVVLDVDVRPKIIVLNANLELVAEYQAKGN